MKFEKMVKQEFDIVRLSIDVAVRYDEDDIPNDFPFRNGDMWTVSVDVYTHTIIGWPQGKTGAFTMKICDQGSYTLYDGGGKEVACIDNDYVPNNLLPGEYGDYLELHINESGVITNWLSDANFDDFSSGEE